MHDLSTTIVAVATPTGRGGIGCVRISGADALVIAGAVFRPVGTAGSRPDDRPCFGTFLDRDGHDVDHGYLVAFSSGRAFTGEPTVELWCHGSPPVLEAVTRAAIARGAFAAGPGEFTYRALRHGRLDLTRAEAIRDLIAARTLYQARVAFRQVEGALARRLTPLRDALVELLAAGEAAIEFADEAETHLERGALAAGLKSALSQARGLVEESRRGRLVREGARVALSGVTSVGKSSLFNRLLGRDRAIVSPVAGTTRDTLEETLDLDGIPATVVDTAGVRVPVDDIEAEGARRAREAVHEADLVLLVLDASRPLRAEESTALAERAAGGAVPSIVVANKIDLAADGAEMTWPAAIPVSALTGDGLTALRRAMREALCGPGPFEDPILTNDRHVAALEAAVEALDRATEAMPMGDEIVLEEVRSALGALGELTGELANDDLYDRIFSTYCIGK
jgi:tRNA modification GTPase